MKRAFILAGLAFTLFIHAQPTAAAWQTQSTGAPPAQAGDKAKSGAKVDAAILKTYTGRYEVGASIIPVTTLDVTLENDSLWVKPTLVKKRRLLPTRSRRSFLDEIEGKRYTFNRDEEGRVVSLTFQYEGSAYTAQKVVLPPPSLKGNTTFKLKGYADARVVVLAGSFNNWNESQLLFAREGDEWVCRVDLAPNRYTYKFIVDGNWLLDPANPDTEEDEYGNLNSVLIIKEN
ncbi:MAG TPA: DUF3471 domain-containing protein [Pyrinomonadaceae bacterium]|jgi:hypothetical protein|nr:DUF3471 domain-containing protein [Pyrinomonadaceae bacterium]